MLFITAPTSAFAQPDLTRGAIPDDGGATTGAHARGNTSGTTIAGDASDVSGQTTFVPETGDNVAANGQVTETSDVVPTWHGAPVNDGGAETGFHDRGNTSGNTIAGDADDASGNETVVPETGDNVAANGQAQEAAPVNTATFADAASNAADAGAEWPATAHGVTPDEGGSTTGAHDRGNTSGNTIAGDAGDGTNGQTVVPEHGDNQAANGQVTETSDVVPTTHGTPVNDGGDATGAHDRGNTSGNTIAGDADDATNGQTVSMTRGDDWAANNQASE